MIHYRITRAQLENLIDAERPTWRKRANALTRRHRKEKQFTGENIWSEIKPVYMKLQHYKCAYCERPLAEGAGARIEYAIEHFRPKGRVTPWPHAQVRTRRRIRYSVRRGAAQGYPRLAHSYLNYLASCPRCNSSLKQDAFPIAGKPAPSVEDIATLNRREQPLLLFPLGDWGDDPERFITFLGCVPLPVKRRGLAYKRAQVSIDLFELDSRLELLRGRAHLVLVLWEKLEQERTGNASDRAKATDWLDEFMHDGQHHLACARAFIQLYRTDLPLATQHYEAACDLVQSKEPKLYEKWIKKAQRS